MPKDELIDLFAQDTGDLLLDLEQALIQLEEDPEDPELVNRIFRIAHTIKGNAGIVGLTEIASFTHRIETVLDKVRGGSTAPDEALISTLLRAVDVIRTLVTALPVQLGPDELPDLRALLADLDSAPAPSTARPSPAGMQAAEAAPVAWDLELRFHPDLLRAGHDPLLLLEELTQLGPVEDVQVDTASLPGFRGLDPTTLHLSWRLRLHSARGRGPIDDLLSFLPEGNEVSVRAAPAAPPPAPSPAEPPPPAPRPPPTPVLAPATPPPPPLAEVPAEAPALATAPQARVEAAKPDSIRVSVDVLDKLMSLAGEMVLTRNQLLQGTQHADQQQLGRAIQRVNLLTAELQDAVMATRMQPIRNVLDVFKRTVRDLARAQGKRVRLLIEDEDVELDKTVIEAIADPLAHLVRNAVDHGIETPAERVQAGKPEEGTLRLRAAHRAGQVLVEVWDDGHGIDLERVSAKAVAAGLITPQQSTTMSPRAIRDLVFMPGFSTADRVTQLSGRGVGLDVVHTNLASIGGTVQLESNPGQGSTFRVTLPLTLAILPSLLVEAEGERFAIPQAHLDELLRIPAHEVGTRLRRLGGVEVLQLRDRLLPLVRLRDLLHIEEPTWYDPTQGRRLQDRRRNIADRRSGEPEGTVPRHDRRGGADRRSAPTSAVSIALLTAGEDSFGLVVDGFLDSVEIVVKPLGRHLRGCACYAGATVLGDGHAALILDIAGMAREGAIAEKSDCASAHKDAAAPSEEVSEQLELLLLQGAPGELFGLPLDLVERVERVPRAALRDVGGRRVVRLGAASIPVFSVDQAASTAPLPDHDYLHLVIFRLGGRQMGLLVADIYDIVQVPAELDELTHRQPAILGSIPLGPHDVLLVDPKELVFAVEPGWKQTLEAAPSGQARKQLLVVEDSAFFLNHIAAMLEEAGYDVAKAENGAIGLELLRRNPERWDLVLTDIEMPVMDGFEMVERLRAEPALARLPVIAVTSLMGPEARQRGRDAGIDEYSIKLDRDQVLERCRHLLARGRQ